MRSDHPISIDRRDKRSPFSSLSLSLSFSLSLSLVSLSRLKNQENVFFFLPKFLFDFSLLNPYVWIHGPHHAMCPPLIRVRFCTETIYFFSVQFILNELSSSHFLKPFSLSFEEPGKCFFFSSQNSFLTFPYLILMFGYMAHIMPCVHHSFGSVFAPKQFISFQFNLF